MFEERVSRIFKKPLWRVDRKSLARRATHKNIQFTLPHREGFADRGCIEILNRPATHLLIRMVMAEGFASVGVEIVGEDSGSSSLPETFGDSSGSREKIDGLEFHGGFI